MATVKFNGVEAVEPLKFLSPEYVAPIETDGAAREDVVQIASRLLPTMPMVGAEVPLHRLGRELFETDAADP